MDGFGEEGSASGASRQTRSAGVSFLPKKRRGAKGGAAPLITLGHRGIPLNKIGIKL